MPQNEKKISPNLPPNLQGRIFIDRSVLFDEVLSLLRDGPEWRPPEDRCVRRPGADITKGAEERAVQGERRVRETAERGGGRGSHHMRPGLASMAKEQYRCATAAAGYWCATAMLSYCPMLLLGWRTTTVMAYMTLCP